MADEKINRPVRDLSARAAGDRADLPASPLLRLMHLMSPSLPTGGFAYSQGLEWAVEAGWIHDDNSLADWLAQMLEHALCRVDIPVLKRLYHACADNDIEAAEYWTNMLLAMRETREFLLEEQNRGRALAALIRSFYPEEGCLPGFQKWSAIMKSSQLAGYAFAGSWWDIPLESLAAGYLWSWLENQVMAGIKLIPLGQTQGHRLMFAFDGKVMDAAEKGLKTADDEIGASMPGMAIGSCLHERQYTRLFRS